MPLLVRGIFMPKTWPVKAMGAVPNRGIGRAKRGPKGEKVGKGG